MKTFYTIGCMIALLAVTSCSSIKTSFDYDSSVDFSSLKTYAFSEGISELPLNDINRDRLINAVSTQMAAKGFTQSENPDVIIDLYLTAQQKRTATANTTGMGGMYGRGWGWGGGMSTTTVNYNDYTVGTLFINMIDASREQLVWQGRGEKTVSEGASPEKREKNINNAVARSSAGTLPSRNQP